MNAARLMLAEDSGAEAEWIVDRAPGRTFRRALSLVEARDAGIKFAA